MILEFVYLQRKTVCRFTDLESNLSIIFFFLLKVKNERLEIGKVSDDYDCMLQAHLVKSCMGTSVKVWGSWMTRKIRGTGHHALISQAEGNLFFPSSLLPRDFNQNHQGLQEGREAKKKRKIGKGKRNKVGSE